MTNPRDYPDEILSAETGRVLRRGVKTMTITVDGYAFSYGQPGWWTSPDDPADTEGQLADEDNVVPAAARREACCLSQQEAARVLADCAWVSTRS